MNLVLSCSLHILLLIFFFYFVLALSRVEHNAHFDTSGRCLSHFLYESTLSWLALPLELLRLVQRATLVASLHARSYSTLASVVVSKWIFSSVVATRHLGEEELGTLVNPHLVKNSLAALIRYIIKQEPCVDKVAYGYRRSNRSGRPLV